MKFLDTEKQFTYLHYVIESKIAYLDYKALARETAKDKKLALIKRMVLTGWPENKLREWPDDIKPYALRKDEIAIEKECLIWGQRVIIPLKL